MADELVPDEVVDSSPIDGSGANLPPDMFPPVDHWSEVDPDYEDIPAVEPEEDDEEEVPEEDEEPYGGHEDADPLRPYWVRYELHGRNLDSGEGWEALATADFNGDFEVAVEHLTAGARWEFRLRLVDRDGRPSKWSEPLQIDLPTDFTPPPAPTAPIISNVHGYTTMTWDGELTGERPEDFSHVVAYVRQMHPEGDPEGEPGDPRRVGTLSGKGDFPLLQFLGGVLHEAHFTAVDTSGNESPWSDTVQFTPTPPVDAEEIQQELEEAHQRLEQAEADFEEGNEQRRQEIEDLRDNVIPALQDALNTGLDDVYRDAQAYAEAQADDAVNQAAANAQSEYDRLQELAEKALSRAGDNVLEDPSFETGYWFDMWEGRGGRQYTPSSDSRTGDQAMAIGPGVTWYLPFDTIDVEPDDSWRLTIWYRTEGNPDLDRGSGTILLIAGGGVGVLAQSTVFEPVGEYTRAVVTVTVPEGVETLTAQMYVTHSQGTLIVDDVSFQEVGAAAEALRLAEVARQQAEAAHIAAGNAVDTAANAYDAASSKSTVHWSLSAPSGTADNTDDVWWQYELRNGKRVVIGQWFWDNGVWRETEIAEEWLPRVNIGTGTYGDLHGDRLEANTVKAGALAVMPDGADFAPGPGGYEDLWTVGSNNAIVSSGSDPSGAQLRVSPSGSTASRTHGPWIRAQAGDTIYYRMYVGRTNTPDAPLRIYFMYDGSYTSWDSVWRENASGWVEGVHTVPDHVESTVAFSLYAPGGSQGNYWIRHMEVRKQVKGVLIEPEGIKSPQVDTQEFFSSSAVIDRLSVATARAMEITAERGFIGGALLEDNSVTADKIVVTEELVGRFAQFLVVEADMLAANAIQAMHISAGALDGHTITGSTIQTGHSMSNGGVRIVSSGSTYRIQAFDENGQERFAVGTGNAFFRGRLHAGPSMSRGVAIDYGLKLITTGWTDIEQSPEILEEHYTPYVELVEEGETYLNTPMIYIGKEGGMNITPGRYNGTPPGSGQLRLWGHTRANKLISRHLEIPTSHADQPGGMFRDGPRTRLSGRTADQGSSTDMFVTTNTGYYEFESGRETRSGSTTWAAPPPLGVRRPIAQAHSNSGGFDAQRTFSVTTYNSTSSGFSWRITRISGTSGNNRVWIRTISAWT